METKVQEAKYVVGAPEDFPPDSQKVVTVRGREIGIFNISGELHAIPNLCPHQLGPLCEGRVSGTLDAKRENDWKLEWVHDGQIVACPWHGLEYHIPTGQCLAYAAIKLRTYKVVVEKGKVMVVI